MILNFQSRGGLAPVWHSGSSRVSAIGRGAALASPAVFAGEPPLCVDLDGTLLQGDLLWECLASMARGHFWRLFLVPFWLLRGISYLKTRLAKSSRLDVALLPYRRDFLEWLYKEHCGGRQIFLVSAAHETLVARVAAHFGIFQDYAGSSQSLNLKGAAKKQLLENWFPHGFDYCGDSEADRVVWQAARKRIAVGSGAAALQLVKDGQCALHFPAGNLLGALVRLCRPLHWIKNALIVVPLITAHLLELQPGIRALMMWLAFSLCASAGYVFNDLMDIQSDRSHARKSRRPLASGEVPIPLALGLAPCLALIAMLIAHALGNGALAVLAIYLGSTIAYSKYFKRVLVADAIWLSMLYLTRIVAGHVVTGVAYSPWNLSFTLFIFLSLAFSKRAAELRRFKSSGSSQLPGRGYQLQDLDAIRCGGIGCGIAAAVVFCLYLNSDLVIGTYRQWEMLWALLPVLFYWLVRFWVLTERGAVQDDPILFAAKDRPTYVVAGFAILTMLLATHQWFPHPLIKR